MTFEQFLPFTNLYSADDALRIVEAADRPNGGLCVDIWHHTRGSNDLAMLSRLPGEKVMAIQINEGAAAPVYDDYYTECLKSRLPVGEGSFDVTGFIRTLDGIGANVPWALEVPNADAWQEPEATPWVTRCASGLRQAFAAARP